FVPAIHALLHDDKQRKAWMPGTSPGMTELGCHAFHPREEEHLGAVGLPARGAAARGAAAEGAAGGRRAAGLHPGPRRRHRAALASKQPSAALRELALLSHQARYLRAGGPD